MNLDLQLVLKNSLRNRRRSMLTIASMAVSICLIGVLLALSRALFYGGDTTPGQAKRLIVHHKIALTQDLPVAYEQTIQKIPGFYVMEEGHFTALRRETSSQAAIGAVARDGRAYDLRALVAF